MSEPIKINAGSMVKGNINRNKPAGPAKSGEVAAEFDQAMDITDLQNIRYIFRVSAGVCSLSVKSNAQQGEFAEWLKDNPDALKGIQPGKDTGIYFIDAIKNEDGSFTVTQSEITI